VSEPVPEYASVILLTPDDDIVLQLRDDNPEIVDPNCLSLFAGMLRAGEEPASGARRCIRDETELVLGELEFFFTYETTVERHGRISKSHSFIARNINVEEVKVHQGQGFALIHNEGDLDNFEFALISKDILQRYFSRLSP
jgi:ADP-ribose pyrophosphatase YjhB (NUDIX family)